MLKKFFILKIIIFLVFFPVPSYSITFFKTSYVNFKIADGWACKAFGVNWVCHHFLEKGAKPALIFLTARMNSLNNQSLKQTQMFFSKNIRFQKFEINRHLWQESFYQNNFLVGFFSRSVTTSCCDKAKDKIDIVINFQATEENYPKYATQFLVAIKSLNVESNLKDTIRKIKNQTKQHDQDMLSYTEKILAEEDFENKPIKEPDIIARLIVWLMLFCLVALLLLFFYGFYKRRKRRLRRARRSHRHGR